MTVIYAVCTGSYDDWGPVVFFTTMELAEAAKAAGVGDDIVQYFLLDAVPTKKTYYHVDACISKDEESPINTRVVEEWDFESEVEDPFILVTTRAREGGMKFVRSIGYDKDAMVEAVTEEMKKIRESFNEV